MTAIANVSLTNTFDEWRTITNQLVFLANEVEANGNLVRVQSNTSAITVTANIGRGDIIYVNANVSYNIADQSRANLASANVVNAVHNVLTVAFAQANTSYNHANAAFFQANQAFLEANTAETWAVAAFDRGNNVFIHANSSYNQANQAFSKANAANVLAFNSAAGANAWVNTVYGFTNTYTQAVGTAGNTYAESTAAGANAYARTVGTAGNTYAESTAAGANAYARTVGTAGNTYAVVIGAASNAWTNTVFGLSNAYAQAVGTAANNYAEATAAGANAYARTVGTAGNNYTITVGAASNAWTNTVFGLSNAYAQAVGTAGNTYTRTVGTAGNTYAQTVGAASNLITGNAFFQANQAFYTANTANTRAEDAHTRIDTLILTSNSNTAIVTELAGTAFAKANAANVLAFNTGAGANAWANTIGVYANAWANVIGVNANAYANIIGTRANNFALSLGTQIDKFNTYISSTGTAVNAISGAAFFQANQAFALANAANVLAFNALPNTSGISFNGNLNFPSGNIGLGTSSATVRLDIEGASTESFIGTGSVSGNVLNVTAITSGTLTVGDYITFDSLNLKFGAYIRTFSTGSGGLGDYFLSESATVGSSTFRSTNLKDKTLRITKNDTVIQTGEPIGIIQFSSTDSSIDSKDEVRSFIGVQAASTDGSAEFVIGTASGANSATERLRITKDGALSFNGSAVGAAGTILRSQGASLPMIYEADKAYDQANAANVLAFNSAAGANAWANTIGTRSNNYALSLGTQIDKFNTYISSTGTAVNAISGAAFFQANLAFAKANAANVLAFNSAAGANAWTNTVFDLSNSYTQTVGSAGNNYAGITVSAAANGWANTIGSRSNAYALLITGAAFDKANAANVLAFNSAAGANAWANTIGTRSNNYSLSIVGDAFDKANAANITADQAFNKANAANVLAFNSAAGANAWANTIGTRSNNYSLSIVGNAFDKANAANVLAFTSGNEAEGAFFRANAAHAKANAANVLAYNASLSTVKATNLDGGATGQIAYQTAADTTGFLSAGTYGKVLKSSGTGIAPVWDTVPTYAEDYSYVGVTSGTGTATEYSGTSLDTVDYTVPTWARRITILLNQVTPSGTGNDIGIRLGDSGGIESTGYVAASTIMTGLAGNYVNSHTGAFYINAYTYGITYTGSIVLTRMGSTTTWICSGMLVNDGTSSLLMVAGRKSLSGNITTVRIFAEGSVTFDITGGFSVTYE